MRRAAPVANLPAQLPARLVMLWVAILGVAAAPLRAQQPAPTGLAADPYDAAEGLGYRSVGPGWWSKNHGAGDVERSLGGWPLLWVETRHFRIGCGLVERPLPDDPHDREALRADLDKLRLLVPSVPAKVTQLDPWLQVHLLAFWLEGWHDALHEQLGAPPAALGLGPIDPENPLALEDRVGVLVLEREIDLRRYARAFAPECASGPVHHALSGMRVVGVCMQPPGQYLGSIPLRQHLAFHGVQGLLRSAWGDRGDLPHWWERGVASWFQRRADARYNELPPSARRLLDVPSRWQWQERVAARVAHGIDPGSLEVFSWRGDGELDLTDAAMCWSRVGFLMESAPGGAGAFLAHCKQLEPTAFHGASAARVAFASRTALQAGYGLDPETFDQRWRAWVRTQRD